MALPSAPRAVVFQQVHGCRASGFHNLGLALAPRIFELKTSSHYTDGCQHAFNMELSDETSSNIRQRACS
eukprot:9392498-Pyramimonas_sp.AAC.1